MRQASISRKTKETDIQLTWELDGQGQYDIETGMPFLDHMLELFARHGAFNLKLRAKGDTEVDLHHTTEDIGIVLGQALAKAIGEKKGINRYGAAYIPMDETLARAVIDVSGRSCLVFQAVLPSSKVGEFAPELVREFFQAFTNQAQITLHLKLEYGENTHHMIEALFKAFGKALNQAIKINAGMEEIPSTKGVL